MTANQLNNLLQIGASDKVRAHLKKLSLRDRLPVLHDLIPYVNDTPGNLKFFHENFAREIGALISSGYDYPKAEKMYNFTKGKVTP